jgi:hypothetical protein
MLVFQPAGTLFNCEQGWVDYPGPGEKIQISTEYGSEPIWTANGRELLYRGATPTTIPVLSAAIESWSPFRAGVG